MSSNETLKVLQIASSGMEFFHEQVRVLRGLGIDCDVLYYPPDSRKKKQIHDGLLRKVYGHNPIYYAIRGSLFYPKIVQSTLQTDYDIIHVNSGVVAPLGLLQPQRPIVLTLWGDDLLGNRLAGYQSEITKICAKRSNEIIVRNEEMKNVLPCDATIIPSGVDTSRFRPMDQTASKKAVGWNAADLHVIFPYPKSQTKKRYHIAEQLVEQANMALDETVQLQTISGVDHEDMPQYYNAADVLLLPSLREGSPNTVKEAMACNVPVVSSDVGDVRERLDPVSNSYVCSDDSELKDALVTVLQTGGRSDGREYVEEVSLDRMGERIVAIYKSLLGDTEEQNQETI